MCFSHPRPPWKSAWLISRLPKKNASLCRFMLCSIHSFAVSFYICYKSHRYARPHHVIVERRPAVFGHEDRLDEETDIADIAPQALRHLKLTVAVGGHDDSHVNVAVGVGVALGIGAEHHDFRLHVEAGAYDSLVSADEFEGLVAGKCPSIHCCICLVSSMICRQACGVSMRASSSLSSG